MYRARARFLPRQDFGSGTIRADFISTHYIDNARLVSWCFHFLFPMCGFVFVAVAPIKRIFVAYRSSRRIA